MLSEIRTLLWLQWRLNVAMFRSRRLHLWARLGRMLLALLTLVFSLPFFALTAAALAFAMTRLSPQGAYELAIVANSGVLLVWLLLPASYTGDLIERLDLPRLFVHPVSLGGLVVGSTLTSLFSYIGVWAALLLLGQIVGLAWHGPLSLPFIVAGAVSAFAILALGGRLMEDLYDLVAGDRRLRGLLLFLLSLPFAAIFLGNYYIQYIAQDPGRVGRLIEPLVGDLEGLGFLRTVDLLLVSLRPSRLLVWLPTGWATAGMALPVAGEWARGLGFLALAGGTAAGMLWVHAAAIRHMVLGGGVRLRSQRVRGQRWTMALPGPVQFRALFTKDWLYIRRSPVTVRALLVTPVVAVSFGFALWQLQVFVTQDNPLRQALPFVAAGLFVASVNLALSNLSGNYFGAIDREGFAMLMLSPIDRRHVFLAASLATLLLALAQTLPLLVMGAFLFRSWALLPLGLVLAVCLHLSTAPAYALAGIIGAQRDPLDVWQMNSRGNLWIFLAWLVAAPPVLLMVLLPAVLWRPGLAIGVPLALLYTAAVYLLTLRPLAALLDRRADRILSAVREQG